MTLRLPHLLSLVLGLTLTVSVHAFNCAPVTPLLSPIVLESTIADITIVEQLEIEVADPEIPTVTYARSATAVSINKIYQGAIEGDSVPLIHEQLPWCTIDISGLPVGARYVLALKLNQSGDYTVVFGTQGLVVNNGNVEGVIRDFGCPVAQNCGTRPEMMSLQQFDQLQQAYFAGARSGLQIGSRNNAFFSFDNRSLNLGRVRLYRDFEHSFSGRPPLGVVEATLRLESGAEGNLVFSLEQLKSD